MMLVAAFVIEAAGAVSAAIIGNAPAAALLGAFAGIDFCRVAARHRGRQ